MLRKEKNMQINNYQPNQNPNFGARFVSNVKDLSINTKKVGALFEKLTKDSPNETLILDKIDALGTASDLFILRDNKNNKLAKVACSFTRHSKIDENPENQASLLNDIFRFVKGRVKENAAFKEIEDQMNKLREQEKILYAKELKLEKLQFKNIMQDAAKYNIEISDLKPVGVESPTYNLIFYYP